ncbi:serine hydrolase domain-containing protein [Leeuwenhoekiella sp. A16]|uniref:serine hydrolase domain-containing protein n=1 Tax=unclassified Leeuwenhoekiella TaxID=2615029 RepID=UPI003A8076ED
MKILLLLILTVASIHAQDTTLTKLDHFFNLLEENNVMMGDFSVFKDGKEVYQKTIGYVDIDAGIKADKNTKYRIGSITKTFTATIIMQLVENGKLKIDTPLSSYFSEVPNADKISIENMLRHQSGIFNITDESDSNKWVIKPQSRKAMLKRLMKHPSIFEAGTKTAYSNSNYILLSYIAEDITGETYSENIKSRIVDPLNLERTEYGHDIKTSDNEAIPYIPVNGVWKPFPVISDMSVPMGAGAIVSTATELNEFYQALFSGKLVSDNSLKQMTDVSTGMGMGFGAGSFSNRNGFGHDGAIDAFQSFALHMPEENISIAITTNATSLPLQYILTSAISIYFGEEYEFPEFKPKKPFLELTSAELKQYAGTYSSPDFPLKITIDHNKNKLTAQASGQSAFPLEAIAKYTFKSFDEMITLTFNIHEKTLLLQQLGFPEHLLTMEE